MTRHPADEFGDALLKKCHRQNVRRSGPGGQHRNKVETGVRLKHLESGVEAEASETRSQATNLTRALHRLRVQLALEVRSDRSTTEPSDLWQQRCPRGTIRVNPDHADFPGLLAESLDVAAERDFDLRSAAEFLGCSTSQLIKFFKVEPRALELVNRERSDRGIHPLR